MSVTRHSPAPFVDLADLPRLLTIPEVASVARAPITSVRGWLATGRLQSVRPGRRRLIPRDALERFLAGDAQ
jgi:excisionase family DNA binding protein